MSIKGLLMPAITQRLLSRARLLEQRAGAERARIYRGERNQVHYCAAAVAAHRSASSALRQRLGHCATFFYGGE